LVPGYAKRTITPLRIAGRIVVGFAVRSVRRPGASTQLTGRLGPHRCQAKREVAGEMQRYLLKGAVALSVIVAIGFPTGTVLACVGDCNNDNMVTVNEILTMVNIALGSGDAADCMAGDRNGDQTITVDEILAAVGSALTGCNAPTPTPIPGCHSDADCTDPRYPNCGPDGNCWTLPCSDVCSGGQSCCGGDYPYCGPDGSCWNVPCATLCGSTCCNSTQTCQNNTSCSP
jgi:hypothetical protein